MEQNNNYIFPMIGTKAPAFQAVTTRGNINFPEDYKGKWVIFFSHPSDFTPVCTTEFMAFSSIQEDLRKLNTELLGLSVDSLFSHIAWLREIENFEWDGIKKPPMRFPLIEDIKMDIAKKYGMIQAQSDIQAVRAVFIIDPNGIIRTILYYPASTGRNMDEIKRIIMALQKADKDKVATPANWRPGKDVILPPPRTMGAAEERIEMDANYIDVYCLDWFMCFKKE